MIPARTPDLTSSPHAETAHAAVSDRRYPTLELIDSVLGEGVPAFAGDPNVQSLERHARTLANDYWPKHVWLTGLVSPMQLAAVVEPLDEERERRLEAIRLLVAAEPARVDPPAARQPR